MLRWRSPLRGFCTVQQLWLTALCASYQSVVHSQTLPIMSKSPYPLGRYRPTVRCRRSRHHRCSGSGTPRQVLAIHCPPGVISSPQAYSAPSRPPRAANSHSASVGTCLPTHCAYASTSAQACTTGADLALVADRTVRTLRKPVGTRNPRPPAVRVAQIYRPARETNTLDPATSIAGSALG